MPKLTGQLREGDRVRTRALTKEIVTNSVKGGRLRTVGEINTPPDGGEKRIVKFTDGRMALAGPSVWWQGPDDS